MEKDKLLESLDRLLSPLRNTAILAAIQSNKDESEREKEIFELDCIYELAKDAIVDAIAEKHKTKEEEKDFLETNKKIHSLLGADKKVIGYCLKGQNFQFRLFDSFSKIVCCLQADQNQLFFPMELERFVAKFPGIDCAEFIEPYPKWTCVKFSNIDELEKLTEVFRTVYDYCNAGYL